MDIGPKLIYQCPNCGKIIGYRSLFSVNDFGATSYSDGRTRGIMYADSPEIVKCKKCKTFFWLKKENQIGEYGPLTINSKWEKAPEAESLTKNEYIEALNLKAYKNKDQERYVRCNLWRALNYSMGENEKAIYESNCKKLIKLYNMEDIDEKLLIAELYRNIGNFSESMTILKTIRKKEYIRIKKLLIQECQKENKKTIELTDENREIKE